MAHTEARTMRPSTEDMRRKHFVLQLRPLVGLKPRTTNPGKTHKADRTALLSPQFLTWVR
jgi:hypothetical protein